MTDGNVIGKPADKDIEIYYSFVGKMDLPE